MCPAKDDTTNTRARAGHTSSRIDLVAGVVTVDGWQKKPSITGIVAAGIASNTSVMDNLAPWLMAEKMSRTAPYGKNLSTKTAFEYTKERSDEPEHDY